MYQQERLLQELVLDAYAEWWHHLEEFQMESALQEEYLKLKQLLADHQQEMQLLYEYGFLIPEARLIQGVSGIQPESVTSYASRVIRLAEQYPSGAEEMLPLVRRVIQQLELA